MGDKRHDLRPELSNVQQANGRRDGKQQRSIKRRQKLEESAIDVIAAHGISGLTHRLVAKAAGVSPGATTYYFDTRFDIVAAASDLTLRGYTETLCYLAQRVKNSARSNRIFSDLVVMLVRNACARDRARSLCWLEIMLDARRHDESLALAHRWFGEIGGLWHDIAAGSNARLAPKTARSTIDFLSGLILIGCALGLDGRRLGDVLVEGADPLICWRPAPPAPSAILVQRQTAKSAATKERIIQAAIEILITDGPSHIGNRAIAQHTGLTLGAPFYHFPTIDLLLAAAQRRLFEESKTRYRISPDHAEAGAMTMERLIDRTTAIFMREATEYASLNLASQTVWLQSARQPELRQIVWSAFEDQHRAWLHILERIYPASPRDALCAQAIFIGKMLRIIATGSTMPDLEAVRSEFAHDLAALCAQDFWLR